MASRSEILVIDLACKLEYRETNLKQNELEYWETDLKQNETNLHFQTLEGTRNNMRPKIVNDGNLSQRSKAVASTECSRAQAHCCRPVRNNCTVKRAEWIRVQWFVDVGQTVGRHRKLNKRCLSNEDRQKI